MTRHYVAARALRAARGAEVARWSRVPLARTPAAPTGVDDRQRREDAEADLDGAAPAQRFACTKCRDRRHGGGAGAPDATRRSRPPSSPRPSSSAGALLRGAHGRRRSDARHVRRRRLRRPRASPRATRSRRRRRRSSSRRRPTAASTCVWSGVAAPDLAGYIVLRGDGPSAHTAAAHARADHRDDVSATRPCSRA